MKKSTLLLFLVIFFSHVSLALVETERITLNFESDAYKLQEEHFSALDQFLSTLRIEGDFEFIITGHTDGDGDDEYNLDLSKKRANSILEYFETIGVNTSTARVDYKGEQEPLANNSDHVKKRINRRVEIIFKRYHFENIEELIRELDIENSTGYTFDPTRDQTLQGRSGTILKIEENSFLDENGSIYKGEVELKLTEAFDLQKYFEEGLSTMADGKLLVSGGMYRLEAQQKNGSPLNLANGKSVQVAMPTNNMQEGMNVFVSNNGAEWDMTDQKPLTSNTDFELPEKPRIKYPKWKMPKYKIDKKHKPIKPSEPVHPKMPKMPNEAAYQAKAKWYQLKDRKAIRAQASSRFHKAKQKYEDDLKSFNSKYPEFEIECDAYSGKLNRYYEELSKWKLDEEDRKRKFYRELKPENYKEYWKKVEFYRSQHSEKLEAWKMECDSIMNRYFATIDELGVPPSEQASRYIFQQAELGWINIDRFYKLEGNKTDLIVRNGNRKINGRVFIHFPEIGSCMNLYIEDEIAQQKNFPTKEPAKLVAYQINDGGIQWYENDITGKSDVELNYKTIKFSEFRKKISELSNV